jgi:hypothetical protein
MLISGHLFSENSESFFSPGSWPSFIHSFISISDALFSISWVLVGLLSIS